MKRPAVIDPPDYEFESRADYDSGICSCPACGEFYEWAGRVIRCSCGFSFPTDWWHQYSKGCSDGMRVANGGEVSGGMRRRAEHHPYYRAGFDDPSPDAWKRKDEIEWTQVVGPIELLLVLRDYSYCDRCGHDKTDGRENSSQDCQQCEADTTCKHLRREDRGGVGLDWICALGVDIKSHVSDSPGWAARLPCRYFEGGCPVACDKFEPIGIDAVRADDEERRIALRFVSKNVLT